MVKIYAIVLVAGVTVLIAWIFLTYLGGNVPSWSQVEPEVRLGRAGRRAVAAMVGFGLAGMSAEFSPFDLSWPVGLILALLGAAALAWYAGWVDRSRSSRGLVAGTGPDRS